LLRPEFWAEDGPIFFAQAWNGSAIHALGFTYAGYLEVLPRLVALFGTTVGLRWAPVLFNLVALAVQVAPASFFVSSRCQSLVKAVRARVLLAGVYLVLPSAELNATLTNVQWHLALLAFLIVIATPPRHWWAQVGDGLVIALATLTGPFGLFLLPVAVVWYRRYRLAATRNLIWIATLGTAIQIVAWAAGPGRPHAVLGASLRSFVEIAANRVVLAGSFAQDVNPPLTIAHLQTTGAFLLAIAVVAGALALTGLAFWRGPLSLKLMIGYASAMFVGGIFSPALSINPAWPYLAHSPKGYTSTGSRYFLITEVAWLVVVIWWISRTRVRVLRACLIAALCGALGWGSAHEWSYPAFEDLHAGVFASALSAARPGTVITVPVNPVDISYARALARIARGHAAGVLIAPPGSTTMALRAH
jgi:hypothetical protein